MKPPTWSVGHTKGTSQTLHSKESNVVSWSHRRQVIYLLSKALFPEWLCKEYFKFNMKIYLELKLSEKERRYMKEEIIKFKSLRKKWHQAPRHCKTIFFCFFRWHQYGADSYLLPPHLQCDHPIRCFIWFCCLYLLTFFETS